jgi:hypothetical protein
MPRSILLWIPKALALIVLTALAFPLAPFLALFIRQSEESVITGFPSQFPGKQRDFLIPALYIWQTPDAPVDEFWYGEDYAPTGFFKTRFNQADYDSKAWLRLVLEEIVLMDNRYLLKHWKLIKILGQKLS